MNKLVQETLYEQIPLSKAMGIEVLRADEEEVRLRAPLEQNINHKLTAFGGSLSTLSILACWCMIFVRLHRRDIHAHIVIHSSTADYLSPVRQDLEAVCRVDDENAFEKMIKMYQRYGKGRVRLAAKIFDQEKLAVAFSGEYVIHR